MSSLLYPRHERRAEKVREVLREKGIDVIMLTHLEKILYVAGTYHNDWNEGNCVFLWANEDPTLLTVCSEKGRLWLEGYIRDIRYWNFPFAGLEPISFQDKCIEILHERGLEKGNIAVLEPSINWVTYSRLREEFPQANFVNGEDLINEVMRVKDEEELSLLKRVAGMADAAFQAVIDNVRVGITEAELAGIGEQEMRELGCAYWYSPTQMSFDNRVIADHIPSENVLQRGDIIGCDFHGVWKQYRSDYYRTLCFGKPGREWEKMAENCCKLGNEMIDSLRPGNSTKQIAMAFREGVKSAGYPDPAPKDLGHGIGTAHLPPLFCVGENWTLKENEVVVPCPYIHDPGNYTFLNEITVLAHKNGGIPLNKHPLEVIVVDR